MLSKWFELPSDGAIASTKFNIELVEPELGEVMFNPLPTQMTVIANNRQMRHMERK